MNKLRELFFTYPLEGIEAASAWLAIVWGLWLLLPPWNSFLASHSYDTMAFFANEATWGAGMFLVGLTQLRLLSGSKNKRRAYTAAIVTGLWAFIATMFALSNLPTGFFIAHTLYAMFMFATTFRLTQHAYGND